MRNRNKQRQLRKQKKTQEKIIQTRNLYGNRDLTPCNAVRQMKGLNLLYK